ncbi:MULTISPECIES: hypothetical protein [unclassified Variovorax]|uniref:hypothetical protein n=1 Tax=unclassified Variovorax TaxID=663243 RepID=UPI001BD2F8CC|nr:MULTISPECIES: hypothetical protein [unclassified Variovorax]
MEPGKSQPAGIAVVLAARERGHPAALARQQRTLLFQPVAARELSAPMRASASIASWSTIGCTMA